MAREKSVLKHRLWIAGQVVLSVAGLALLVEAILAVAVFLGWTSVRITGQVLEWDTQLYLLVNGWSRPDVTGLILLLLNDPGLDYVAVIIPCLLYVWFRRRQDIAWAILAVVIALMMGSISIEYTQFNGLRERPFVHIPNAVIDPDWRQIWLLFPTFPSGHMRELTGVTVVLAYFWRGARIPAICYAALIATTRLYLGAHFPTDIAAGIFIGLMDGALAVLTVNRLAWFVKLAGGLGWLRRGFAYVFVPRSPGEWSRDPIPARIIRLSVFLGALFAGAFFGGWFITFHGLAIVFDLMRNFDNSVTLPLLTRFDTQWAGTLYQLFSSGQVIYPVLGVLVLFVASLKGRKSLVRGALTLVLIGLLAFLLTQALGLRFDRQLPHSVFPGSLTPEWLLPLVGLTAFPQTHMVVISALVGSLVRFYRPLIPAAYAYMFAVAATLLYFGAAWPMDIVISMLLGQAVANYAHYFTLNVAPLLTQVPSAVQPAAMEESEIASS